MGACVSGVDVVTELLSVQRTQLRVCPSTNGCQLYTRLPSPPLPFPPLPSPLLTSPPLPFPSSCCYLSVCLLLLMAGGAVCTGLLFPRTVTVQQYKYSSGFWTVNNGTSLGSTKDLQITMPIQVGRVGSGVGSGGGVRGWGQG